LNRKGLNRTQLTVNPENLKVKVILFDRLYGALNRRSVILDTYKLNTDTSETALLLNFVLLNTARK